MYMNHIIKIILMKSIFNYKDKKYTEEEVEQRVRQEFLRKVIKVHVC